MAEQKSTTPIYDKHKKYHDVVGKLKRMHRDKYSTNFYSKMHEYVHKYIDSKKADDGMIHWEAIGGEKAHRAFSDSIWDNAAEHIAKDYLKLSDATIKELKGKKGPEGGSIWEDMMAKFMGDIDKDGLWNQVKNVEEFSHENANDLYVDLVSQQHRQYRSSSMLKDQIKEPEDMDGIANYLSTAKSHNKDAMKPFRARKKFRSIEDAITSLSRAAQYVPKTYHPDKKDTYDSN